MSDRKTPVLLRRAPLSGTIRALTNYRWVNGGRTIEARANGKHDVTADFDALVMEYLLEPAPDIIGILDGVAKDLPLTADEREQTRAFREALKVLVERHNAGPHVKLPAQREEAP